MNSIPDYVIAPLLGGFSGALVAYFTTKFQLKNSDLAILLAEARSEIRKMEELGIRYWRMSASDPELENIAVGIKSASKRLGTHMLLLSEENWVFEGVTSRLIDFRRAVTGGQFEAAGRDAEPQRVAEIQDAANALLAAVFRSRRSAR